jgi:uncharacterized protein (UPF0332 family)
VVNLYSMAHQFRLADTALHEAEHLLKAGYFTSSISNAYQVALRSAAGLLYQRGLKPLTEREVRIAFAASFISPGFTPIEHDHAFRKLEKMRHEADFGLDYMATKGEAEEACRLAKAFREEASRIEKEGPAHVR